MKTYKNKETYDSLPPKKKAQSGNNYLTILKITKGHTEIVAPDSMKRISSVSSPNGKFNKKPP